MSKLLGVTLEMDHGKSWAAIETLEDDGFVVTARHELADAPVLLSRRRAQPEDLVKLQRHRGDLLETAGRLARRLGLLR